MIRVMLADDNENMVKLMRAYLDAKPDVQVVASARDGREALEVLRECVPDVLLLDLHMPVTDGLGTLSRLGNNPALRDVRTIVLTSMISDMLARQTMLMGATYFMIKPLRPQDLYERILFLTGGAVCAKETPRRNPRERRASALLRELGIQDNCKGSAYLNWALKRFACAGPDLQMTKRVYPEVAKFFHVDQRNVECAMRSAIGSAWKRGAAPMVRMFDHKPCNAELLARLIRILEEE